MKNAYKTILIKLSGEALGDSNSNSILNAKKLKDIVKMIKDLHGKGINIGVVAGAGNIFRGRISDEIGVVTEDGDYMGMVGTVINLKALSSLLNQANIPNHLYSALEVEDVATKYSKANAQESMKKHEVALFAGGIGKPHYTTDTCAASRAIDIKADCILFGKYGVDGVYDKDPNKCSDAKFLKDLSYQDVLDKDLKVMDQSAVKLLLGTDIVTRVFAMDDLSNFIKVAEGNDMGTTIKE